MTIIGSCAAELDALATGIFVLGLDRGAEILKARGLEAVAVTNRGKILATPRAEQLFSIAWYEPGHKIIKSQGE